MALHYINWLHVKGHLDKVSFDEANETLDIDQVKLKAEEAESKFDQRFSRRFDLPFTLAAEPEAFALTQIIVSMWAAAEYLRTARQTQASREQLWYADQLDAQANERVEMLQVRRQPDDATENDDPIVHIPSDGETSSSEVRDAIFKRAHITAGSSEHW
jgi:hypothetical protein